MEWIKVEKQLPNEGEEVIVFVNGFSTIAEYKGYGDTGWTVLRGIGIIDPFDYYSLKPTHWQPLPKAPK